MTQAYPLMPPGTCPTPGCSLTGPVAAHGAAIADLKDSNQRVETKLDRLVWGITCTALTSAGALLALLYSLLSPNQVNQRRIDHEALYGKNTSVAAARQASGKVRDEARGKSWDAETQAIRRLESR